MRRTQAKPYILTAQVILLMMVLFVQVTAHPFYKYYVVAETGKNGLVSIDPNLSVNSKGTVAFVGKIRYNNTNDLVENIFVANGDGSSLRSITSTVSLNPIQQFSPGIQINDNDQIVARRFVTEVFPPPLSNIVWSYLERWDATQINTFERVKMATLGQTLWGIYGYPTINNIGAMGYGAFNRNTQLLGLVSPSGDPTVNAGANDYRPMYADNGTIAIRFAPPTNRLFVFDEKDNLLKPKTFIAGTENGFSYIGQSPGISDDGTVMAFYGENSDGPGIFIAIPGSSNPQLTTPIKVAGVKTLKNLDSNKIYGEMGVDATGKPIFLTDFNRDERISVIHRDTGISGLEGDTFTICYTATPTAPDQVVLKERGIWVTRVDIINGNPIVSRPQPVLQVGESFGGSKVTDIRLYDSLSNTSTDYFGDPRQPERGDHQIAFWAKTTSGEKIIRGMYFDTDGDGLPDHWEMAGGGVDIEEDGVDLNLNILGANPKYKDIFVEIDSMTGHEPRSESLEKVRLAFDNAPVQNPNKVPGINLHLDSSEAGEIIPKVDIIAFHKDINFDPHFFELKELFFGSAKERASINKEKLLKARLLVFRYCIFGNQYLRDNVGGTFLTRSGGISEIGGDDLFVGFDPKAIMPLIQGIKKDFGKNADAEFTDLEASVFMHELGHTLGLRHGGFENANYKPNYLSVMNYSFTTNERGCDISNTAKCNEILTGRVLDYSREALATLDEFILNENDGIGIISTSLFPKTLFGVNGKKWISKQLQLGSLNSIDWDANGSPDIISSNDDIDFLAGKSSPSPGKRLKGYDDWQNLNYNFRSSSQYFANSAPLEAEESDEEQDFQQQFIEETLPAYTPFPEITTISPSSTKAGSLSFLLKIVGSNFSSGAVAKLAGKALNTSRISDNELQAQVEASSLGQPGIFQINVENTEFKKVSNGVLFIITAAQPNAPITITKLDPKTTSAGEQKTVTVEATLAPSEPLLTNSVTLLRYNDKDELVGNLGQMFDDGTHGDRIAGDKIFTTQIIVNEAVPQTIFFKASAAYKGQLKRLISPPETLTVTPSTQSLQRSSPTKRLPTPRTISPRP